MSRLVSVMSRLVMIMRMSVMSRSVMIMRMSVMSGSVMRVLNLITVLCLALCLGVGCAKVREENQVPDGNQERFEKSMLTGLEAVESNDIRLFSDYDNRFDPTQGQKGKIWLHKATVTNVSSFGGPLFIGLQGMISAGYFRFGKDKLEFMNAINPNRNDDGKLDQVIFSWNVKHSEHRYREIDGRPTNTLEENNFIPWSSKGFFIVDWVQDGSLKLSWEERLGKCWDVRDTQIIPSSRIMEKDYFSYTSIVTYVLNTQTCSPGIRRMWVGGRTFQAEFTHSYKRLTEESNPEEKYKPYVYNGEYDPLIQKYGYFKTMYEERKDNGQLKVNFMMDRWNNKRAKHTIYFAPGFPDKYKWIWKTDPNKKDPVGQPVIGVIDRTNQVFKENGIDMRFEIQEPPEGVKFGDSRYSFIKFMEEANPYSPLGYGPSDNNPFTGEIVAANTMVWTASLERYVEFIDEWVKRSDLETGSSQSIYEEMAKIMDTEASIQGIQSWTSTATDLQHHTPVGHVFKKMLPEFTYGLPFFAPFTTSHTVTDEGLIKFPVEETGVFAFDNVSYLQNKFGSLMDTKILDMINSVKNDGVEFLKNIDIQQNKNKQNKNNLTIYRMDSALNGVEDLIVQGKTTQEIIDAILYRVSIHEFGHNLSLRHNFYGSVDKNNFGPDQQKVGKGGDVVAVYKGLSSSVMDYHSLTDGIHLVYDWEPYDKAALAYAYSDGRVDHSKEVYPVDHKLAGEQKHFLYCEDWQRFFNAMCSAWDNGTTPSEIVMNLIDSYQRSYWTVNRRFDRAYWDTRSYESRMFGTMWNIKKFMMLDQVGFTYGNKELSPSFRDQGVASIQESRFLEPIKRDLRRAVKISVAFYNSVLQQSDVERQYFSEYDEPTGALIRKGIFADKLYATYFLLGDDGFYYNPNIPIPFASYLEYEQDPDVGPAIRKVSENLLTSRVDSEPGFINFARVMYADAAYNFYNQNNVELASKFQLSCYSPKEFKKVFGQNPYKYHYSDENEPIELLADIVSVTELPKGHDLSFSYFQNAVSELGYAFIDGKVYVASKSQNPVAFNVIEKLNETYTIGTSRLPLRQQDVRDLRSLYLAISGAEDYCL